MRRCWWGATATSSPSSPGGSPTSSTRFRFRSRTGGRRGDRRGFDVWDAEVIALPPSLGGVVLDDGIPSPVYPEVGTGVDRPPARAIVEATLLALEPKQTSIPTTAVVPVLTDEDVDRAVAEAEAMLVEPIQLDHEDVEVVFTVDQLTEGLPGDRDRERATDRQLLRSRGDRWIPELHTKRGRGRAGERDLRDLR